MPWRREGKIFCITIYLETRSFKTVSKYMQPINMIMIYYRDNKHKNIVVLEADIIVIKTTTFNVSNSKDPSFTGRFPNMTGIALV